MNLVELRKKHGLTQDQLAQKMGVKRITINRYENQKSQPSRSFWYHLAYILGTNPEKLVGSVS